MNKKAELNKSMAKSTSKFSFPFLTALLVIGFLLIAFTDYQELGESLIWIAIYLTIILIALVVGLMAIMMLVIGVAISND